MKSGLTLKFLLKATFVCVLLTIVEILFNHFQTVRIDYNSEFKAILSWIALFIAWAIYFLEVFRKSRKNQEEDPWNKKGKDPW